MQLQGGNRRGSQGTASWWQRTEAVRLEADGHGRHGGWLMGLCNVTVVAGSARGKGSRAASASRLGECVAGEEEGGERWLAAGGGEGLRGGDVDARSGGDGQGAVAGGVTEPRRQGRCGGGATVEFARMLGWGEGGGGRVSWEVFTSGNGRSELGKTTRVTGSGRLGKLGGAVEVPAWDDLPPVKKKKRGGLMCNGSGFWRFG